MNLGSLTNSINSGVKFIEKSVEEQADFVKNEGEKCVNVVENVVVDGGNVIEGGIQEVGEGVKLVGDTAVGCVNLVDGGVENIMKLKNICQNVYDFAFRFKGYLEDESVIKSTLALIVWLAVCYFFEIWMIPLAVLLIYMKNLIMHYIFGAPSEEEKTVGQSAKEKMQAIQEIIGLVRAVINHLEAILEKIFGFINLKSLHLSWLAILIQVVVTFVLMYIPINFLLMLWGISLYSKKFLKKKPAPGEEDKKDGATVVEATEELQDVAGDFLSLNFIKGFNQIKDAYGKLSSKCD